jgi:hypothetical protein
MPRSNRINCWTILAASSAAIIQPAATAASTAAPDAYESTKSPQELGTCLSKRLGTAALVRPEGADRISITIVDSRGEARWEVVSTPEGARAVLRSSGTADPGGANIDACV